MADLPISGLEVVIKGAQQAIRELKAYNASIQESTKANVQAAKVASNTSKFTSALSKDFSSMGKNILSSIPGISRFSNVLGSLSGAGTAAAAGTQAAATGTTALAGSMSLALPLIGAAVVALGGLFALGKRGAQLQTTIDAFGNIAGQFGDSTDMLERLREQTKGTISDMNLMRIATFALSGTSKELGTILAANLGKNLNDIGRLAAAIGRDPVEAQNRWIDAIKKGERELLDELGIVVSANEAYERYAKSVNKSADSLTAYEKQAAFAQEATRQLNDAVSKLPEQSTILTTLQRIPVVFKNILDKLSLAVQPVFEPFLAAINMVISAIETFSDYAIPVLHTVFQVIGTVVTEIGNTVGTIVHEIFGGFADGAGRVLPYVVAAFQLAGEAIITIVKFIGDGLRTLISGFFNILRSIASPIKKLFGSVGDNINLNINQLAFNLGKGGAFIVGAFAGGILRGGTFVLRAVTAIAQIVADFLMGFSPPKKGILSNIDKGGENTAIAWTEGFLGGVQKSFSQVTAYVDSRLGAIATLSRDQIEVRLKMLDLALRPFRENLAIVKADMEAIAGFTDPALRILERQRSALLKAFGEGKIADIDQLRNLDRQIQRMKELKDFGQDQVDQAELQLSIAQSKQAQERTLLGIVKDRLGVEEKIKEEKEKKGTGTAAQDLGTGGAGVPFTGGEAPDLLSNDAIDNAKANIIKVLTGIGQAASAGISEGLADSGFGESLAGFKGQAGALKTQLGRIAESNPVQAIADKFSGLKDSVKGAWDDFKNFINDTWKGLFDSPDGTIPRLLENAKTKISEIFGSGSILEAAQKTFETFKTGVETAWKALFADPDGVVPRLVNGVKTLIQNIFGGDENPLQKAVEKLGEIRTKLGEMFSDIFGFDLTSAAQTVYGVITDVFDGAKDLVEGLLDTEAVQSMKNTIKNVVGSVLDAVTSIDVEGILGKFGSVMSGMAQFILDFPSDALDKLGDLVGQIGGLFSVYDDPNKPNVTLAEAMKVPEIMSNLNAVAGIQGQLAPQQNPVQATMDLLAGANFTLSEEVKTKLNGLGIQVTKAISDGINSEDAIGAMQEALAALATNITDSFAAMFTSEESPIMLAQTAIISFVTVVGEQMELLRSTMEMKLIETGGYLSSLFESQDGIVQKTPGLVTAVLDQIINQFMRLTNSGEGTLNQALSTIGAVMTSKLISPTAEAAQAVANTLIDAMNSIIQEFNRLPSGQTFPMLSRIIVPVHGIQGYEKGTLGGIKSAFIAGEKGAELIMPSKNNPLSVFPAKATNALTALAGIMERPAPMPQYVIPQAAPMSQENNNIQNSYNSNRNVTFNSRYKMSRLEQLQLASRA